MIAYLRACYFPHVPLGAGLAVCFGTSICMLLLWLGLGLIVRVNLLLSLTLT